MNKLLSTSIKKYLSIPSKELQQLPTSIWHNAKHEEVVNSN